MSLSTLLEVIIGFAFIYLLLSLTTTWINEWVAHALNLRGKDLQETVRKLLQDSDVITRFEDHPLIKTLAEQKSAKKTRLPSYMPTQTFGLVLIEILFGDKKKDLTSIKLEDLEAAINVMPAELKEVVLTLFNNGYQELGLLREGLETWFENTMDRLSGTYKRKMSLLSFFIGLSLAIILNIDTIAVGRQLALNPILREGLADAAGKYVVNKFNQTFPLDTDVTQAPAIEELRSNLTTIVGLDLPIGWNRPNIPDAQKEFNKAITGRTLLLGLPYGLWAVLVAWLPTFLGWLLTGVAVSQGAPFWFQVLNKFINLRSSGPPAETETAKKTQNTSPGAKAPPPSPTS